MLKYVLLATVMTVSAPVLAQTTNPTQTAPATAEVPTGTASGAMNRSGQDTTATPSTDTAQTATAPTDATAPADQSAATGQPAPATTAPAQTAATPTDSGGVTSVVDKEFASYDKDSNGSLSKAEFGAWMDALKAKSPNGDTAAADPKWNDKAFAQADTDKSKALSKTELASFLSSATKSAS